MIPSSYSISDADWCQVAVKEDETMKDKFSLVMDACSGMEEKGVGRGILTIKVTNDTN